METICLPHNQSEIDGIAMLPEGKLVTFTANGLQLYLDDDWEPIGLNLDRRGRTAADRITCLAVDPLGYVILGMHSGVIRHWRPQAETVDDMFYAADQVRGLQVLNDDTLAVLTRTGVEMHNQDAVVYLPSPLSRDLTSFAVDQTDAGTRVVASAERKKIVSPLQLVIWDKTGHGQPIDPNGASRLLLLDAHYTVLSHGIPRGGMDVIDFNGDHPKLFGIDGHANQPAHVEIVRARRNGAGFVSGDSMGSLSVWGPDNDGVRLEQKLQHNGAIVDAAVHIIQEGEIVIAASARRSVRVWNTTGELLVDLTMSNNVSRLFTSRASYQGEPAIEVLAQEDRGRLERVWIDPGTGRLKSI